MRVGTAAEIVRKLAAIEDPTVPDRDYPVSLFECGLCWAREPEITHDPECPWRLARQWVDSDRLDLSAAATAEVPAILRLPADQIPGMTMAKAKELLGIEGDNPNGILLVPTELEYDADVPSA